ncbi:MAG: prepilin peptidase [Acidimicrobiales bacterium]|nr:prepilin peptidase [Acidimicrobiales bacterium]
MVVGIVGAAVASDARVLVTAAAAVTGIAVGSFLNVVVYRVPRALSVVRPASFCPACGTPIGTWDNVPLLSWLVLRGRCRHCGEPISARYPVVEAATGALFAAVAWVLGPHWGVPGMCLLGATVVALAAIELDGMAPPASVSLVGTALGAVLLSAGALADRRWWHLGGLWIGIAVAAGVSAAGTLAARGRGVTSTPLWALVPAGAVMGWVGGVGVAVGVATAAVVLVGASVFPRTRLSTRTRQGQSRKVSGLALAGAVASAAALVSAFVAGSSIGP